MGGWADTLGASDIIFRHGFLGHSDFRGHFQRTRHCKSSEIEQKLVVTQFKQCFPYDSNCTGLVRLGYVSFSLVWFGLLNINGYGRKASIQYLQHQIASILNVMCIFTSVPSSK